MQGALTAWFFLREANPQPGQKVLVFAASGGVGTFAVQIARALGAEVTGVCSGKNAGLVRSIGAEEVIDYQQIDFTQCGSNYDLILDIVANRSVRTNLAALKPGGAYVAVAVNPAALILGSFISRRRGMTVAALSHKPNPADLDLVCDLLVSGAVVPVIDKAFPLSETAQAMRYLVSGEHHGKVVITVEPEGQEEMKRVMAGEVAARTS